MLVKTYGSAVHGIHARLITIEVNVGPTFGYAIVGLPDNAVKESWERVKTSFTNNQLDFPRSRITINLAPADVRKEGSAYDLPIALAILAASGQLLAEKLNDYMIMGELSLDGTLQKVRGALPIAICAKKLGFKGVILPEENAFEAGIVDGLAVIPVKNLREAVGFLNGTEKIFPVENCTEEIFQHAYHVIADDFSDVKGQENIKRAMEVAAAGGHNVIMIGPPGSGKTMLARRLPGILPPMTLDEALETTKIHSVAGKLDPKKSLIATRPFRSPHHTISDVALVGGGGTPQPGEISMAHNGVLFLDELPEFKRTVLEVMRQPLEERKVTVSRAKMTVEYPASFMLVSSMNPCPCGYHNHPEKNCICSPQQVHKYMGKISGPLLDRIDIQIEVTPVKFDELVSHAKGETSAIIRERVLRARVLQQDRYHETPGIYCNAMLPNSLVRKYCRINSESESLLKSAVTRLGLSARAFDRILKVSRTIADLNDSVDIQTEHVAEAIQYRSMDRENWAG